MNMGDPDSVTRVSYRNNPGFLQRIGNSLMGIGVGLALIVMASGLLYWNKVCFLDMKGLLVLELTILPFYWVLVHNKLFISVS
jgi:hypothetical protein